MQRGKFSYDVKYSLPDFLVSVVIPTLAADSRLRECVESLGRQTRQDFEVIIVDNSGEGVVRSDQRRGGAARLRDTRGRGVWGGVATRGFQAPTAPFPAPLNDDAAADPRWL